MKKLNYMLMLLIGLASAFLGLCCQNPKSGETYKPKARALEVKHRPLNVGEIFKIASDFEDVMNHNPPTMADFELLYGGTEAVARQEFAENNYCQSALKVDPASRECSKAMKSLGWKSGSSLYLLVIKNIITEGKASAIEIYIDPSTKACASTNGTNSVKAQALANNKLHDLTLVLPCDFAEAKNQSAIVDFIIDGKSLTDQLKVMKAPISLRR